MACATDDKPRWERVRALPLTVETCTATGLVLDTNSGFQRHTTELHLSGAGHTGSGEDVTWDKDRQLELRGHVTGLDLGGAFTLESFSARLDETELWPTPPQDTAWRDYRRWAFESAALDLALRQNGLGLEETLGAALAPVHFGVSLGLRDFEPVAQRLAVHADMRFKLDATPDWSAELCARLAETGAVDVVDFKGAYVGTPVDVVADPALYARVLDALPDVIVEDPHDEPRVLALLRERGARVSWDAPIHSLADVDRMPLPAAALNIKPSRFGPLRRLFETYDACRTRGLPAYGGGQFELGVGRRQVQLLAGLFHPDGPNDVAPRGYHQLDLDEERPASPLRLALPAAGFDLV